MAKLTPIDYDPFAAKGPKLTEVDYDPFKSEDRNVSSQKETIVPYPRTAQDPSQTGRDKLDPSAGLVFKEGMKDVARQFVTFSAAMEENRARVAKQRGVDPTGRGLIRRPTPRESRLGIEPSMPMFKSEQHMQDYISGARQRSKDLMAFADRKLKAKDIKNVGGFKQYGYDVIRMAPQIMAQIGITAATGGLGGGVFMGVQIGGASYDDLIKQGVDHELAFKAMFVNAAAQAPLEAIGLSKALKFWKPGKTAKKWMKGFASGAGGEFITEWAQKYPELITHQWAIGKQAGLSDQEILDSIVENLGEATKEGIYEGLVAAPFGGTFGGFGGAVTSKTPDIKAEEEAKTTPPPAAGGTTVAPHIGKTYKTDTGFVRVESRLPDGSYRIQTQAGRQQFRGDVSGNYLDRVARRAAEDKAKAQPTEPDGNIGRKSDGKPYKTKQAAGFAMTKLKLKDTHQVVPVEGGFKIAPKSIDKVSKPAPKQTLYDDKVAPIGDETYITHAEVEDQMASRWDTDLAGQSSMVSVPVNADPNQGWMVIPRKALKKDKVYFERRGKYGEETGIGNWADQLESLMNLKDKDGKRKWKFGWMLDVAEKNGWEIRYTITDPDIHPKSFKVERQASTEANARAIVRHDNKGNEVERYALITLNGKLMQTRPFWKNQFTVAHELVHGILRHRLGALDSKSNRKLHEDMKKVWTNISEADRRKLVQIIASQSKVDKARGRLMPRTSGLASLYNRLVTAEKAKDSLETRAEFEELASYALSDPTVARALNTIQVKSPVSGKKMSLWDVLIAKIAKFVGRGQKPTVLTQIVDVLNEHAEIKIDDTQARKLLGDIKQERKGPRDVQEQRGRPGKGRSDQVLQAQKRVTFTDKQIKDAKDEAGVKQDTPHRQISIDPLVYLNLTTATNKRKQAITKSAPAKLDPKEIAKSSAPLLVIGKDGTVTGHDGRHRAATYAKTGQKSMPIVLLGNIDPEVIQAQKFGEKQRGTRLRLRPAEKPPEKEKRQPTKKKVPEPPPIKDEELERMAKEAEELERKIEAYGEEPPKKVRKPRKVKQKAVKRTPEGIVGVKPVKPAETSAPPTKQEIEEKLNLASLTGIKDIQALAEKAREMTYRQKRAIRSEIRSTLKEMRNDYNWLKRAIRQFPDHPEVQKQHKIYDDAWKDIMKVRAMLKDLEQIKPKAKMPTTKEAKMDAFKANKDLANMLERDPESLLHEINRLATKLAAKEATEDEKVRLEIAKRLARDSAEIQALEGSFTKRVAAKAEGAKKARGKKKEKRVSKAAETLEKDVIRLQGLLDKKQPLPPSEVQPILKRLGELIETNPKEAEEISERVLSLVEQLTGDIDSGVQESTEVFPHKIADKFITMLLNKAAPGHKFVYEGYSPEGYAPQGYSFHASDPASPIHGTSITISDLSDESIQRAVRDRIVLFRETADKPTEQYEDPNAEAAHQRYRKGVPGKRIGELWNEFKEGIVKGTREFGSIAFKDRKLAAKLTFALRKLTKQKQISAQKAIDHLSNNLKGLTTAQYDVLERTAYLTDFWEQLDIDEQMAREKGVKVEYRELPEGFTPDIVRKEAPKYYNQVMSDPVLKKAWNHRLDAWDKIRDNYIKAMGDVGYDARSKMRRAFYFRHQILDFMQAKRMLSPEAAAKLALPTSRSHLKKRKGSKLPMNLNYVQAEHEVMTQLMYDTELARVMKLVRDEFDIAGELRAVAKEEGIDNWESLVGKGPYENYDIWQPQKGHVMYLVDTITSQIADQVLSGQLKQVKVTAKHIGKALAVGRPFRKLVLPKEIIEVLEHDSMNASKSGIVARTIAGAQTYWKRWQLIAPHRFLKYNARNMTGDAEAMFLGNPRAFRRVPEAIKQMKARSPQFKDWINFGGHETTMQAQEMGRLLRRPEFAHLQGLKGRKAIQALMKVKNFPRKMTDAREAMLRFAAYLDYLERLNEDGSWKSQKDVNYGASMREEVDGLTDKKSKAFMLSNDLLGAYDRISAAGAIIRKFLAPFWSFQEINFTRTFHMYRNAIKDERMMATIGRHFGAKTPIVAMKMGKLAFKFMLLSSLAVAYNNAIWPDAEDALPEELRRRSHIILWATKGEDPQIIYFPRIGLLGDLLEWGGLDTAPADLYDLILGKRKFKEIARDYTMAEGEKYGTISRLAFTRSLVNKVAQMVGPHVKIPIESIMQIKLFPDVFDIKPQLDKPLVHLVNEVLGSKGIVDTLSREPDKLKAAGHVIATTAIYKQDIKRMAYLATLDSIEEIRRELGKVGDGFYKTRRGMAVHDFAVAWRYGDQAGVAKAIVDYIKVDPTTFDMKNLKRHIKNLHPLHGLDKITKGLLFSRMGKRELYQLKLALEYFAEIKAGKQFGHGRKK